ncbi:hypothetical protein FRC04_010133 [Tulasnella sp. 424]|nr:hypothetical protein FRC04_010133 [Tulasnella sp. 424]KAG8972540.1 hypothetical protein FRC05_009773 [Tulasnella sp. 425]
MPSSSIIAHRMRSSAFSSDSYQAAAPPTISSFIDGLSPHPSVNAHPFLSATPPPLIQGLERHPDAPKSFATDLLMEYAGLPTYNDHWESETQTRYSQFTDDGLPSASGGSSLFDTEMLTYAQPTATNSIGSFSASRYSEGSAFKPSTRFRSRLSQQPQQHQPVEEEDCSHIQNETESSFFVNQAFTPSAYYPELPICNDISPTPSVLSAGSTDSTESADSDSTGSSNSQLDILSPSSCEGSGFSSGYPFDDSNSSLGASIQTATRQKPTLAMNTSLPLVTLVDADEEERGNPCSPMYNPFSPMTTLFGDVGGLSRYVSKSKSRSPVSAKPGAVSRLLMDYFRGVEQ